MPSVKRHLSQMGVAIKALLLLDNAPFHPDESVLQSSDKCIKAMFFPPNTTALIQPMDQGVLESLKRRYHKSPLQKLLLHDQEGYSMIEFIKKLNVKDAVYMSAEAWEDIPPLTLSKSWLKLLGTGHRIRETSEEMVEGETCEELTIQLDSNLSDRDISDWVNADSSDPGYALLSDQDIIQQLTCSNPPLPTEDESEDEESCNHIPTNGEVMEMLDKCLTWYECQTEATPTSMK